MEESLVIKKLLDVDRKLHSIIEELRMKRTKKSLTLSELTVLMERDRVSDEDSTRLIRGMRDKPSGV